VRAIGRSPPSRILTLRTGTPISESVGGRRWFLGVTGLLTVAHPMLPAQPRAITYLLVSALAVVPIATLLRRLTSANRLAWWILLGAMTVLTAGNALTAFGGPAQRASAEMAITVAHTMLLAAAVRIAIRRGRNDLGGMLDVSVGTVGLGGLLWTRCCSRDSPPWGWIWADNSRCSSACWCSRVCWAP
jgi:hypothetical protein